MTMPEKPGRSAVAAVGEAGVVAGRSILLPIVMVEARRFYRRREELLRTHMPSALGLVMTPEEYRTEVLELNRAKAALYHASRIPASGLLWLVPVIAVLGAIILAITTYIVAEELFQHTGNSALVGALVFGAASIGGAISEAGLICNYVTAYVCQRQFQTVLDAATARWQHRGVAWTQTISPPVPSLEPGVAVDYIMRVCYYYSFIV